MLCYYCVITDKTLTLYLILDCFMEKIPIPYFSIFNKINCQPYLILAFSMK